MYSEIGFFLNLKIVPVASKVINLKVIFFFIFYNGFFIISFEHDPAVCCCFVFERSIN